MCCANALVFRYISNNAAARPLITVFRVGAEGFHVCQMIFRVPPSLHSQAYSPDSSAIIHQFGRCVRRGAVYNCAAHAVPRTFTLLGQPFSNICPFVLCQCPGVLQSENLPAVENPVHLQNATAYPNAHYIWYPSCCA